MIQRILGLLPENQSVQNGQVFRDETIYYQCHSYYQIF